MTEELTSLDQWVAEEAEKASGRERQLYLFFQKDWTEGAWANPLLFPMNMDDAFWRDQFDWYVKVENFSVPKEDTGTVRFPELSRRKKRRPVEADEEPEETVVLGGDVEDDAEPADDGPLETVVLGDDGSVESGPPDPDLLEVVSLDAPADDDGLETVSLDGGEPVPAETVSLDVGDTGDRETVSLFDEEPASADVDNGTIVLVDPPPEPPEGEPGDESSTVTFIHSDRSPLESTFIMESVPVSEFEEEADDEEDEEEDEKPSGKMTAEELGFEPIPENSGMSELDTLIAEDGMAGVVAAEIRPAKKAALPKKKKKKPKAKPAPTPPEPPAEPEESAMDDLDLLDISDFETADEEQAQEPIPAEAAEPAPAPEKKSAPKGRTPAAEDIQLDMGDLDTLEWTDENEN